MLSYCRKGLFVAVLLLLASPELRAGEGLQILVPPGCLPGDGGPAFAMDVYVWGTGGESGKDRSGIQIERGGIRRGTWRSLQ